MLWIVVCTKVTYFVDREGSFNIETDKNLLWLKEQVTSNPIITVLIPLALSVFTEAKINRLYKLGYVHCLMSYSLTLMVATYFFMSTVL